MRTRLPSLDPGRYPSPETEPYILHPLRVMLGVSGVRVRAVAVLHDVLEDTAVTAEELREANLSSEVVDAVTALTRRSQRTARVGIVGAEARCGAPVGRGTGLRGCPCFMGAEASSGGWMTPVGSLINTSTRHRAGSPASRPSVVSPLKG